MNIVIWTIVFFCVLYIVLMQINTNPLMREIESAFYSTDSYVEKSIYEEFPEAFLGDNYILYQNDPNRYNIYALFNYTARGISFGQTTDVYTNLKLYRVFTWHNFNKGTLWLNFSVGVIDNKKKKLINGAADIPVRLEILKENGVWVVTDFYEAP
jgi:hypothetical protein